MSRLSHLAFTYANNFCADNAAAQLYQIYCAYALARFLDVSYIHSPLKEIGSYRCFSLGHHEGSPEVTERYNKIFTLQSECELPEVKNVYTIKEVDLDVLCSLRDKVKNSSKFHLLKMAYPSSIIEKHPQTFRYFKEVSTFEVASSPLFRIAIHIRREDSLSVNSEGILPMSYYITTVLKIIEILHKLDISFVCELYTEPVTLTARDKFIEEFDVVPHLKKMLHNDQLQVMTALGRADLVVLDHSIWSYLPALLNKKGTVVYSPYRYSVPVEWLDSTHETSFQERLADSCKRWKEIQ